jgi:O-methyltransferase
VNILKKFYYTLPSSVFKKINNLGIKLFSDTVPDFINSSYGLNYGLTRKSRVDLLNKFLIINQNIESATSLEIHITLAKNLLQLPVVNETSFIVECGCFKGASTSALSLICDIINRKIIVYDSFKGLPKENFNQKIIYPHLSLSGYYKEGMFKSNLKEFETNVSKFGNINACIVREGFFEQSLKLHKEQIDFIFLDVDLLSSTKTCIKYLWPYLKNEQKVFTDDSCDLNNVKIWFDDNWWKETFNETAPGYIGSGCGLPINQKYSSLGYAIKNLNYSNLSKADWLL